MAETSTEQTTLIPMSVRQLINILVIGAVVGAITWGLTVLLDQYVFKNIVCGGTTSMQCATSLQYANISATILGAGAGLFVLARMLVFRSLLVVIASSASLWGLVTMLQPLGWQVALASSILLSLVAYGLFAWLARIRSFLLVVIIMAVIVIATRLMLNL